MEKFKVLGTLKIGANTAVIIDGKIRHLTIGSEILDENMNGFKVLSIGMEAGTDVKKMLETTSILVRGEFSSDIAYIYF